MKRTSLILIGALAGTVLLTGCGQEAALRPAASDAAGSSPSAAPSSASSPVPTFEPTSKPAAPSTSPSPAAHRHSPTAAVPSNLLDWPARGIESTGPSVSTVAAAYAAAAKAPEVKVRRLFSGNTDAGLRYLIGQAWVPGKSAVTVAYVENPGREPELKIQPATPEGVRLVALLLTDQPGTTTDLLVVVPEPRTTQVSYRTSTTAPWKPAFTYSTLDGVAFVDRAKEPGDDALRLLTGNGDPAAGSTLVLPVSQALCNGAGCP